MKKNLQKGFTLIELLVVIAIIGILASVVLASLNSARAKGADAAVKGGMANMAAQIELYYDSSGNTYGVTNSGAFSGEGNCSTAGAETGAFGDKVVREALIQIRKNSGNATTVTCYTGPGNGPNPSAGQFWAMSAKLKGGTDWCVDNTGYRNAGVAQADGTCGASSGGSGTPTAGGATQSGTGATSSS